MKTIQLLKADALPGEPVESVTIEIHEPLPTWLEDTSESARREMFNEQANKLLDALFVVLPGATIDRILANLMARRALLMSQSLGARP